MKNSKFYSAIVIIFSIVLTACELTGQSTEGKPGVKTYELLGEIATPEGISIDQSTGYIYTGGMQDGSMQVTIKGKSSYFVHPGSGVLLTNVLGSSVDEKNKRIWVCSNDFSKTFSGTPTARVSVLNLKDGSVIKQFNETDLMTVEGVYPFVNDIVLDKSGNAYVANSASNTIFKIKTDLSSVEVLAHKFPTAAEGKKYSLNGIEITHDQQYLISNTFIMSENDAAALFRININTGEVSLINFEEHGTTDFSKSGGDGLLFIDKHTLLCMSVASTILKVELNGNFTNCTITNISNETIAESELIGSATLASYKDKVYTTNAQGMALFNPSVVVQKPYKIIEIPVSALGLNL